MNGHSLSTNPAPCQVTSSACLFDAYKPEKHYNMTTSTTRNAWQSPACSPPGANAPAKLTGPMC